LDTAIANFTTALEMNSVMADYFNYRGLALRSKGEYKKSFADVNQALKISRKFVEANFNRRMVYDIYEHILYLSRQIRGWHQ